MSMDGKKTLNLLYTIFSFYIFSCLLMRFMILGIIAVICISGYIESDTFEKERMAQNIGDYSAFDTISEEDLHLEKIRYEMKMKEMQVLIDNAK